MRWWFRRARPSQLGPPPGVPSVVKCWTIVQHGSQDAVFLADRESSRNPGRPYREVSQPSERHRYFRVRPLMLALVREVNKGAQIVQGTGKLFEQVEGAAMTRFRQLSRAIKAVDADVGGLAHPFVRADRLAQ